MTNDEINEVIAETLGKVDRLSDEEFTTAMKEWEDEPEHPHASLTRPVKVRLLTTADFANDLNAMHEAEKTMTGNQFVEYIRTLKYVCNPGCNLTNEHNQFSHVTATARQRAEAFIRTVCPEKWKGNE